MKFVTEATKSCAPRLGRLSEFERIPSCGFDTPLALTYTRRGAVPHLTKSVFQMVTKEKQLLSVSLPSTITMTDAIKELKTSYSNFVSMQEHISFLSVQDPSTATFKGFRKGEAVPVWTRTGKHLLTADDYMNIVEALKPDLYVALSDSDTDQESGSKRTINAVARNRRYLEDCLKRHAASDVLKSKGILGAIGGGYNKEAREFNVECIKDQPVDGYLIDGLHMNGPEVQNITPGQVEKIVEHTVIVMLIFQKLLAPGKLKVSLGCWNPLTVLQLVNLGVDIFDTSYAFVVTENSRALTFLCDHETCENDGAVMTLAEERYKDDFSPICKKCECTACKEHTRAYLHHLHHTKEMLCQVLLMMHNMHQYMQFFSEIRENLRNDTFPKYTEKIRKKFGETVDLASS